MPIHITILQKNDALTALSANAQANFGYAEKSHALGVTQQFSGDRLVRMLLLGQNLNRGLNAFVHIGGAQEGRRSEEEQGCPQGQEFAERVGHGFSVSAKAGSAYGVYTP
jgi:hypothetical protein